jgi:hypothetical protein
MPLIDSVGSPLEVDRCVVDPAAQRSEGFRGVRGLLVCRPVCDRSDDRGEADGFRRIVKSGAVQVHSDYSPIPLDE